jgi:hypothetical protein
MCLLLYLFSHIIDSLLSQEIALLSNLEHENIVRYLGTEMVLFSCRVFSFACIYVQFDLLFLFTIAEFMLSCIVFFSQAHFDIFLWFTIVEYRFEQQHYRLSQTV